MKATSSYSSFCYQFFLALWFLRHEFYVSVDLPQLCRRIFSTRTRWFASLSIFAPRIVLPSPLGGDLFREFNRLVTITHFVSVSRCYAISFDGSYASIGRDQIDLCSVSSIDRIGITRCIIRASDLRCDATVFQSTVSSSEVWRVTFRNQFPSPNTAWYVVRRRIDSGCCSPNFHSRWREKANELEIVNLPIFSSDCFKFLERFSFISAMRTGVLN